MISHIIHNRVFFQGHFHRFYTTSFSLMFLIVLNETTSRTDQHLQQFRT